MPGELFDCVSELSVRINRLTQADAQGFFRVHSFSGEHQLLSSCNADAARQALTGFSRQRLERIVRWQQELNLSVLPLSAGEETLPQIRRLLGRLAPRRRVR